MQRQLLQRRDTPAVHWLVFATLRELLPAFVRLLQHICYRIFNSDLIYEPMFFEILSRAEVLKTYYVIPDQESALARYS